MTSRDGADVGSARWWRLPEIGVLLYYNGYQLPHL
jgi:hypothetical protein